MDRVDFGPGTPAGAAQDTRRHAIVIGSGFGGLAAAVRLGVRGYRVTVLEQLEAPGGRALVHRQDGFTFDAGPTIVTAPFLFDELWALCGKCREDDVTLVAMDPFYRLRFDDGSWFDCCQDAGRMRAEVARVAPGDVDGYERFMAMSEEILKIGFEQLGHVPFASVVDMLRILPELMRLQAWRDVHSLVARYVQSPKLRVALSFHPLLIGGNPFRASGIYALIAALERRWGVHYAMGGTNRLVAGMVKLIEGQGSEVRCNARVAGIVVESGVARGVRLADGRQLAADIVVSNADSGATYRDLVPAEARGRWTVGKLQRARWSNSLFVWYFGTGRRYPDLPHHLIHLGPRYRELLHDIFDRHVLAKDFSLYLHHPSVTDPSVAPEGCDAFYVLAPVPHLKADVDWATHAEAFRQAVERRLASTVMPGLAESVVTSRMMTPLDFRDRLSSPYGAAFGLEPVLTQSAWFRPHNASEDIRHLYLVGAGTHPGAGLPGVLSSAKVLDTVVPHADALV